MGPSLFFAMFAIAFIAFPQCQGTCARPTSCGSTIISGLTCGYLLGTTILSGPLTERDYGTCANPFSTTTILLLGDPTGVFPTGTRIFDDGLIHELATDSHQCVTHGPADLTDPLSVMMKSHGTGRMQVITVAGKPYLSPVTFLAEDAGEAAEARIFPHRPAPPHPHRPAPPSCYLCYRYRCRCRRHWGGRRDPSYSELPIVSFSPGSVRELRSCGYPEKYSSNCSRTGSRVSIEHTSQVLESL
jgi:hypothetical protein